MRASESRDRPAPRSGTRRERARPRLVASTIVVVALVAAAGPHEPTSEVSRLRALLDEGRWPEALSDARALRDAHPDDPRAVSALGEALFRAGLVEESLTLLEPWAERDDAPPRTMMTLARLWAGSGKRVEAGRLMSRAVDAAPDDPAVLFWGAELAATRATAAALLERFLELGAADDPDRVEAARGSIRVMRELGERPVWVPVERPDRVEVPLRLVWDNTGRSLGYVIKVGLGPKNKPVRLLLDTGSGGLFLVNRMANKRGADPLAEETTFGGGGEQRHRARRVLFSSFTLGGLRFKDAMATTSEHEMDRVGRFHGVIGLSIFDGYRVTLDLAEGRLILEASDTPVEGSPYWSFSGQMLVRAAARGGADGLFLFDTGASWTILSDAFAALLEDARVDRPAEVHGFGGRVEGARAVHGVEMEFQGRAIAGSPLRAIDLSLRSGLAGVEISGYLGLDLLASTIIEIDTTRQRLRVSPAD